MENGLLTLLRWIQERQSKWLGKSKMRRTAATLKVNHLFASRGETWYLKQCSREVIQFKQCWARNRCNYMLSASNKLWPNSSASRLNIDIADVKCLRLSFVTPPRYFISDYYTPNLTVLHPVLFGKMLIANTIGSLPCFLPYTLNMNQWNRHI